MPALGEDPKKGCRINVSTWLLHPLGLSENGVLFLGNGNVHGENDDRLILWGTIV